MPAAQGSTKPIRYGRERRVDARLLALGGFGVLAVGALLAGAWAWSTGRFQPQTSAPSSPNVGPIANEQLPLVAFVDPATGEVTDTVPVRRPTDLAGYADGNFWILDLDPPATLVIDPRTHEVVSTQSIPLQDAGWGTGGDGITWLTDSSAARVIGIDDRTGVVTKDFTFAADAEDTRGASGVALGAGSLWVSIPGNQPREGDIVRLDPSTGVVEARITDLDFPEILAFGEGALWATGDGAMETYRSCHEPGHVHDRP